MKKFLVLLFLTTSAFASLSNVDLQTFGFVNKLSNGGFEQNKAGWTASGGSFAIATSGSNKLEGNASATWDSSAADQTLTSKGYVIENGLLGKNGVAFCSYKCASGTCTHKLQVTDGTNVLAEQNIISDTASAPQTPVNFIFPTSGSVYVRTISVASNEPSVAIDRCGVGLAEGFNVSQFSQATFYGSARWVGTTNCNWSRTSTDSFDHYSADSDCTLPAGSDLEGQASAPATKIPGIHFDTIQAGKYIAVATGLFINLTSGQPCAWSFYDGSMNTDPVHQGSPDAARIEDGVLVGELNYSTAQSNVTVDIVSTGDGGSGQCDIFADTGLRALKISLYRLPTQQETAFKPDQLPMNWSGYHANDCSWSTSSATYADPGIDSSCTFTERTNQNAGTVTSYNDGTPGNNYPGIVFNAKKVGVYEVCANFKSQGPASTSAEIDYEVSDLTPTIINEYQEQMETAGQQVHSIGGCGHYYVSAVGSKTVRIRMKTSTGNNMIAATSGNASAIEWTVKDISLAYPSPLLINSVVSKYAGVSGLESAFVMCSSSSTITDNPGNWISSIGNISSGACVVTLSSGVFSQTPNCTIAGTDSFASGVITLTGDSSTQVTIHGRLSTTGTDLSSFDAHIICVGKR